MHLKTLLMLAFISCSRFLVHVSSRFVFGRLLKTYWKTRVHGRSVFMKKFRRQRFGDCRNLEIFRRGSDRDSSHKNVLDSFVCVTCAS